jgi:CDP-glucose 4,6-dehydratase
VEDLVMDEFWKNKRVLLTGHTGFKGSWLSIWLQKLGVNLIGFSNSIPTKPSLFELAHVKDGMVSVIGDIRDFNSIKNVIKEYNPEIIIHMAAQSLVLQSYNDPIETYSTNVMGTVNILEAIRKVGKVKVVINVTSDKCYENKGQIIKCKEDDPMGGYDPYSNSKGCAELITSSFRNSFFNPADHDKHETALASARAGNVIGGGDWSADRLIPDIMSGILKHERVRIRNPSGVRPWQHVLEPLGGYLLLAEKLWSDGKKYSEGWNFGPNDEDVKPVSWIIDKLSQLWGDTLTWDLYPENHHHEAKYLKLDCTKAKNKLGWSPKTSLEAGLRLTVEWYKQYQRGTNLRQVTEEQIRQFSLL